MKKSTFNVASTECSEEVLMYWTVEHFYGINGMKYERISSAKNYPYQRRPNIKIPQWKNIK